MGHWGRYWGHRSVGTHKCRLKHAAACRSMPQHAAAQEIFPRDRTSLVVTFPLFFSSVQTVISWRSVFHQSRQSSPNTSHQTPDSIPQTPDGIPQTPDSIPQTPDSIPQTPVTRHQTVFTRHQSLDTRQYSPDTRQYSPDTRHQPILPPPHGWAGGSQGLPA